MSRRLMLINVSWQVGLVGFANIARGLFGSGGRAANDWLDHRCDLDRLPRHAAYARLASA